MGRPAGRTNVDHQRTRDALLDRLAAWVTRGKGTHASFREMAAHAGVSPTTLRHYFVDAEGVLAALMAHLHRQGAYFLSEAATRPIDDVRESLAWMLRAVWMGWLAGVGNIHAFGLSSGLREASAGPAYVNEILEPTLQAAEARIARHMAAGQLERADVRHAALALMSPVVMALLHQDGLGGAACRPLDVDAFIQDHLERFLRAYGASPQRPASP